MNFNFSKLLQDLVHVTGVAQGLGLTLPVGVSNAINVADSVATFGATNEALHVATITQHLEAAALEAPQLAGHIADILRPAVEAPTEPEVEACPLPEAPQADTN